MSELTTLDRSTIAGITIADETLSAVRRLIDENLPADRFLARLREVLQIYEPLLAKTLSDAMLAAWIEAQLAIIHGSRLKLHGDRSGLIETAGDFGPPVGPPIPPAMPAPDEPEPVVSYTKIEEAASDLARRRVITADEYYALSGRAKQFAFTVSKIGTEDTLAKMRDALEANVREGGTLRAFRDVVERTVGKSALTPAHIELVYRDNVMAAYSEGQKRILQHPLVRREFPYVLYTAIHDSRLRVEHHAMERRGIDGGAVFRTDDPVIQEFWPPWAWNCRCRAIPITLEMAAERYHVREAIEWLRTGQPPQFPAFVVHPEFYPPAGWRRTMDLAA